MNKSNKQAENKPHTISGVMWRILLMIAITCVAALIGKITPDEYDVSVMFVIGWWCSLIWNEVFP